ncbi:hypothetical protein ALC62_04929, partial [Cyphomyrmex costatus]
LEKERQREREVEKDEERGRKRKREREREREREKDGEEENERKERSACGSLVSHALWTSYSYGSMRPSMDLRGTREIVRCDREKEEEIERERKIEEARESQWYQRVGIVYTELIKTSPFNTPFPLASSRTNTRTPYEVYTYIISHK